MPLPSELVKHLVVLMMENRSFDHMLGHMKSPGTRSKGWMERKPTGIQPGSPCGLQRMRGIRVT